jgi:hypothetical protein
MMVSFVGLLTIWGCATTDPEKDGQTLPLHPMPVSSQTSGPQAIQTAIKNPDAVFSLEDRMLLSSDIQEASPPTPPALGPLYSFRAQALPLVDALALFARSNKLNIVSGPEITGSVTVGFHDLPLERAMSALLEAHGYYWEHYQDLIQVKQFKTKTLNVD